MLKRLFVAWVAVPGVLFGQPEGAGPGDPLEEHNAAFAGLPLEERAWPVYAEIQAVLGARLKEMQELQGAAPGGERWAEAVVLLESMPEVVELAGRAGSRPVLGWAWSDALPAEWVRTVRGEEAEVAEASARPRLVDVTLPYVGTIRAAAALMRLEALRAASEGDTEGAVAALETIGAMTGHFEETATAVTALAAVTTRLGSLVDGVQRVMAIAGPELTEEQLDRLEALVEGVGGEFSEAMVADERAIFLDTMEHVYGDVGEDGAPALSAEGAVLLFRLAGARAPAGLDAEGDEEARAAALTDLRRRVPTREATEEAWREGWEAVATDASAAVWAWSDAPGAAVLRAQSEQARETGMVSPSLLFTAPVQRLAEATQVLRMEADAAKVAIALERYRRAQGGWPESLDALVPEFLSELPRDWIDGEPVRYAMREDGPPLVYSVGPDADDDGGVPAPANVAPRLLYPEQRERLGDAIPSGDWVLWPNEATSATPPTP